jgi:hydrogenase maturation factor
MQSGRLRLIGGETAQMPGMYSPGEYDLAGTIVGVVDRAKMIDGSRIRPGDAVIGLASNGLHTNGLFARAEGPLRANGAEAGEHVTRGWRSRSAKSCCACTGITSRCSRACPLAS